jgi:hypothetical protein
MLGRQRATAGNGSWEACWRVGGCHKNTEPRHSEVLCCSGVAGGQSRLVSQPAGDPGEDTADLSAQQGENGDDHNSHQNKDQRILYQALTFLMGYVQHDVRLLSVGNF